MAAGLDRDTLNLVLGAIREFASSELPDERLLEFDEKDEFPEDVVRGMCGEVLGVSLLFIPEAYGGMGGGAYDVYRVCELLASIDLGIATGALATFLGICWWAYRPGNKSRFEADAMLVFADHENDHVTEADANGGTLQ